MYESEKASVLKCSPLTRSAVYATHLDPQDVKLVLRVFNEKVVASLKQMGYADTDIFIQQVLEWWNECSKGDELRLRNSLRAVYMKRNVKAYFLFFLVSLQLILVMETTAYLSLIHI